MLLTIIVFIVILGLLVFVHELGHFMVAKRNGIKAEEFGFGFPPRIFGVVKNDKTGKYDFIKGSKEVVSKNTLYSLNWFPIGGFVKIKGEDGDGKKEKDSFASKPAWTRVRVLAAGVSMNFLLAWIFLSVTFMVGSYEDVTGQNVQGAKILIESIEPGSPAEMMGLKIGDTLVRNGDGMVFSSVQDVQNYVSENKGREITLVVDRGNGQESLKGTPREQVSSGQGALGISSLGEVVVVKYSFFKALWRGLTEIGNMFVTVFLIFVKLFQGQKTGIEVMGPVKLAAFTGQIIPLGFVFLLRFIAILSVNLGIINILPFPALDGGRILFILIEKMKGSPVSHKVEQAFHTVGLLLLMSLMLFITVREVFTPEVLDKIRGIF